MGSLAHYVQFGIVLSLVIRHAASQVSQSWWCIMGNMKYNSWISRVCMEEFHQRIVKLKLLGFVSVYLLATMVISVRVVNEE